MIRHDSMFTYNNSGHYLALTYFGATVLMPRGPFPIFLLIVFVVFAMRLLIEATEKQ